MPSILDPILDSAKILLIGKSGAGKTGAKASLICAGYKLRMIDTDKGIRVLRSLLTDPRYPYAKVIEARKIDLRDAISFIPIDLEVSVRNIIKRLPNGGTTTEKLLAPKNGNAWLQIADLLDRWKDGERDLGGIMSWGPKDILDLDTLSTAAKMAFYSSQSLNGRLGTREEGNEYRRDIGAAQSALQRLFEGITSSSIRCNVIVTTHITWVDEAHGYAQSPASREQEGSTSSPDGYPSAIGRALSPQIGKYFNDVFCVIATGSGQSVRRQISTIPTDGVICKNSVWLKPAYDITSGLAEIFAALKGEPEPTELIQQLRPTNAGRTQATAGVTRSAPSAPLAAK